MLISILTVLSDRMLISILTVLSILTAVSSLTVVYPKVVLTVVFIPTVVYILTVVSSRFHVIFNSAYTAVRVKSYAYVNMLGRNDDIILFAEKESSRCKPASTRREETNAGTMQMTALVNHCSYGQSSTRFFSHTHKNLECTDVSFNPEKRHLLQIKK